MLRLTSPICNFGGRICPAKLPAYFCRNLASKSPLTSTDFKDSKTSTAIQPKCANSESTALNSKGVSVPRNKPRANHHLNNSDSEIPVLKTDTRIINTNNTLIESMTEVLELYKRDIIRLEANLEIATFGILHLQKNLNIHTLIGTPINNIKNVMN